MINEEKIAKAAESNITGAILFIISAIIFGGIAYAEWLM